MTTMKKFYSYTKDASLRILFLLLLLPISIQAKALDNTVDRYGFCKAPEATSSHDEAFTSTQNDTDLGTITKRGKLRVLLERKQKACIISQTERQLVEQFAKTNNLDVSWIYVDNNWELLPDLLAGKGDIIAGQDHALVAGIQDEVAFTYPWANATYKIVERADDSRISRIEDLSGRQLAAYKDNVIWPKLLELAKSQTGLYIEEIPPTVSYQEVMERVKSGQYDLAVADSLFLDTYLPENSELKASFSLSDEKSMAWAVRASDKQLHKILNQYLNQQSLTHNVATTYFDDLSQIKNRGILRIITTSNPSHYYLNKGKLYGFEYELLKKFAKLNKLRVDVVLAKSQKEMFRLLEQGKGDVVAASLPGSIMAVDKHIQFSKPYHYASPVVVGRDSDKKIIDIRDLSGRRITLAEDSPYWDYMSQLQKQGADFELVKADPGINMEGVLKMVSLGMYDLTVIGNHQVKTRFSKKMGLKAQFALSEPLAHQWALRAEDQQLERALNSFIESEYRGEHYNILLAKYFENPVTPKAKDYSLTRLTSLSPFDKVIQAYAEKYGFDWRLITALMFQESRFNPDAASDAGAEGLMQLIPETAALMGVSDTSNPEKSINGGIRYLSYLRDKFDEKSILLQDRIWFTLASYNAGYGRIKRARELAEKMGLDKNRWFNNVELAMLALAKPYNKEGETVRYCRCGQAVVYVREIRTRYFNYIRLTDTQQVALNTPPPLLTSRETQFN